MTSRPPPRGKQREGRQSLAGTNHPFGKPNRTERDWPSPKMVSVIVYQHECFRDAQILEHFVLETILYILVHHDITLAIRSILWQTIWAAPH